MPTRDYQPYLIERLGDSQYAAQYLKAALDDTLADGDMESILLALKNIVEAKGTKHKQSVANESNITRQHLQRLLSGNGNLTLGALTSVLQTVGLSIDFKPMPADGGDDTSL